MMTQITPKVAAELIDTSFGVQLIATGLAQLVEDEGFTPHEALKIARYTGQNCFHALLELKEEAK
nr:hypothetical protein [Rummeliibacillus sp. TYF-LIM-RU47]